MHRFSTITFPATSYCPILNQLCRLQASRLEICAYVKGTAHKETDLKHLLKFYTLSHSVDSLFCIPSGDTHDSCKSIPVQTEVRHTFELDILPYPIKHLFCIPRGPLANAKLLHKGDKCESARLFDQCKAPAQKKEVWECAAHLPVPSSCTKKGRVRMCQRPRSRLSTHAEISVTLLDARA